jgi:hypothetical protein
MDQRGPEGGSFLDRLSSDLALRQAKAAKARKRAGRYAGAVQEEQLAERGPEQQDLALIRRVGS